MASPHSLVVIDGSHGEGGGALLRTALTMASVTEQAVRINSVRGGTKFPGLDAEDMTVIRALAAMCDAETTGIELGSNAISFLPTRRPKGLTGQIEAFRNETQRGPNACVVLSTLLPVLARSGVYSSVVGEGETFGGNALSYDYFANVTIPALKRAGLYAYPELLHAGFGRESKGQVALDVEPSALNGISWVDRGKLQSVKAIVSTAQLPSPVGERAVSHLKRLAQNSGVSIVVEHIEVGARTPGIYVTAWANYDRAVGGGAAMGARGIRAETLAQHAFEEMYEWMATSGTVDPFLADQLLLPLVLADGESAFSVSRLTPRFLTCAWVIKQFAPIHITIRGAENGPGTVTIKR